MAKKSSKLEKIEQELSRLEKVLKLEENRETKRLTKLKEYIKLYMINPYEGSVKIYKHFSLNQNRYPHNNIIKETLKPKIKSLLPFFKTKKNLSNQGNLFT